jgi:uncharacterized protein (TIGR02646 family)
VEFIKRSAEPKYLLNNKEKWTKNWVDHYRRKRDEDGKLIKEKKPSDNHWTSDSIRGTLISDFKNNCGYCGCTRPTPNSALDKKNSPRGHVDHYRAKAIHPELTYDWSNYIWSCESCNFEKGEFDDPKDPILNPCQLEDCKQLKFIIDNGKYCLINEQGPYEIRLKNTDQLTMLNAGEITVRRRNRVKCIRSFFSTISILLTTDRTDLVESIINDSINNIKKSLEDPEFYFLLQKHYHCLRNQHPQIAQLVDNYELHV